jgi:hypothetical protein
MAKPITGMIPPGGWHYMEGDVKLTSHSYENLLTTVQNYRAENHLPIGDVEGDVSSYLCSNWPNFCHGVDMVVVTSVHPETSQQALLNDITVWAKNILNSGKKNLLVSDELAEQRAQVCKACSENKSWKSGCASCVSAAERVSASIRNGKDTETSVKLGGCNVMRHDNRSAVFMFKKQLSAASNTPKDCWINLNK